MRKPVLTVTEIPNEDYAFEVGLSNALRDDHPSAIGLLASVLSCLYNSTPLTVEDFHWLADHFQKAELVSVTTEAAPLLYKQGEVN